MKIKIFLTLLFSFFIFSLAKATTFSDYEIGQKIENEVNLDKKITIDLSPGEWVIVEKTNWKYNAFSGKVLDLAKLDKVNNEVVEGLSLAFLGTNGKRHADVNTFIYEAFFTGKHDGCYKRPEYYRLELVHKGATINCLIIDHSDTNKELYNPDDKTLAYLDAKLIRWIEDNNIIVPKIMLTSNHIIFARSSSQNLYTIAHGINPKYFNGPKNKYTTEDTSEYHPNNINKYPLHFKFMEKFLSTQSYLHKKIEDILKLKENIRLDLAKYNPEPNKDIIKKDNEDIIDQLKKINDLYKDGVLTKEEFEKAKKNILN